MDVVMLKDFGGSGRTAKASLDRVATQRRRGEGGRQGDWWQHLKNEIRERQVSLPNGMVAQADLVSSICKRRRNGGKGGCCGVEVGIQTRAGSTGTKQSR